MKELLPVQMLEELNILLARAKREASTAAGQEYIRFIEGKIKLFKRRHKL